MGIGCHGMAHGDIEVNLRTVMAWHGHMTTFTTILSHSRAAIEKYKWVYLDFRGL